MGRHVAAPQTEEPDSEYLLTVKAADEVLPGEIVLYTAGVWWFIDEAAPVGKSVDVTYTVIQDAADPDGMNTAGVHRFRASTLLLTITADGNGFASPPVTVDAGSFSPGEVVHYSARQSWLVEAATENGKSIDTEYTVVRDHDDPAVVGTRGEHRFRASTLALISP